ncbi:unnamed protein product [Euphydryas editha]|uniref:Uncharacterized protein n=1 Tax=Euphydryas editha TaxID=104508 RepID=A0AAU9U653_EUPED|nr:unnamed protein product [Euphydryas editha]
MAFYCNVCCNYYDVIVICETWLESELFDNRYVVYRRGRKSTIHQGGSEGGGVQISVSKKINSRHLTEWQSNCEDLWVMLDITVRRGVYKMVSSAVCTLRSLYAATHKAVNLGLFFG